MEKQKGTINKVQKDVILVFNDLVCLDKSCGTEKLHITTWFTCS